MRHDNYQTDTPAPTLTVTPDVTNSLTPKVTEEAAAHVYTGTVVPDNGDPVSFVYDNTVTAGDRVIALLMVVLLIVHMAQFIVLLWQRPKRPRFIAE